MKHILIFLLNFCSLLLIAKENFRDIIYKYDINGFEKEGGTDKDTWHSYLDTYEKLLSNMQDQEIKILEIGVANGGSALLWHQWCQLKNLV